MEEEYRNIDNSDAYKEATHTPNRTTFAQSLISEPPTCPECTKILKKRDLPKCDYCGFHYGYLQKQFPKDLPAIEGVADFSSKLSKSEIKSINKTLKKFKKKYPQLHLKIAALPLQSDVEIQQMGLWMLNECPLNTYETNEDRLWSILLLIDTTGLRSCFASGYKMEVFFPYDIALKLVQHLNASLHNDSLAESISATLDEMMLNLDHSKKLVKKQFKQFKKR